MEAFARDSDDVAAVALESLRASGPPPPFAQVVQTRAAAARKAARAAATSGSPTGATHRATRNSRMWGEAKPHKQSERLLMPDRCFLLPHHKKYPICDKRTHVVDCRGTLAAAQRANLNIRGGSGGVDHAAALRSAGAVARSHGCAWPDATKYPQMFERTLAGDYVKNERRHRRAR